MADSTKPHALPVREVSGAQLPGSRQGQLESLSAATSFFWKTKHLQEIQEATGFTRLSEDISPPPRSFIHSNTLVFSRSFYMVGESMLRTLVCVGESSFVDTQETLYFVIYCVWLDISWQKQPFSVKLQLERTVWFSQMHTDHPNSSSTPPLWPFLLTLLAPCCPFPPPQLLSLRGKAQGDSALFFMATFQPIYLPHNSSTALWSVCKQ